jgi:hypothetical protein
MSWWGLFGRASRPHRPPLPSAASNAPGSLAQPGQRGAKCGGRIHDPGRLSRRGLCRASAACHRPPPSLIQHRAQLREIHAALVFGPRCAGSICGVGLFAHICGVDISAYVFRWARIGASVNPLCRVVNPQIASPFFLAGGQFQWPGPLFRHRLILFTNPRNGRGL